MPRSTLKPIQLMHFQAREVGSEAPSQVGDSESGFFLPGLLAVAPAFAQAPAQLAF